MSKRYEAPGHLPVAQRKQWEGRYNEALKQAKVNHPDNEAAQHTAALREANKMLHVPAPQTAEDIDKLADWQVTQRGDKSIDGENHRYCVTIDGRKYSFPAKAK